MAKSERTELILETLRRELETSSEGVTVAEARKKYSEFADFNDGHLRCALDGAVNTGSLRKIAHRTQKGIGSYPATGYTHKNNPNTKDRETFVNPARAKSAEARKAQTEPKEKRDELSANQRQLLEYVREHQGVSRHDLGISLRAAGMAEPSVSYSFLQLVKNGHIRTEGNRTRKVCWTSDYVPPRKSEEAEPVVETPPPISDASYHTLADTEPPAINGERVYVAHSAPAPQASPAVESIGHHLQGLAQAIADQLTANIVEAVGANLARIMGSLSPVQLPSGSDLMQRVTQAAEIAAKPKRPRIVVAGLKGNNASAMVREFPQFDFDFIDPDHKNGSAVSTARPADRVLCMANFLPHSIDNQLKTHPGYKALHTGMTGLREELRKIPTMQ